MPGLLGTNEFPDLEKKLLHLKGIDMPVTSYIIDKKQSLLK